MKGNGTKIAFTIGFLAIALFYLQYSFRYWLETNHIESLSGDAQEQYLENNHEKIETLKTNSINLGLDLQGGMHVTLELQTGNLLTGLAGDAMDTTFTRALDEAREIADRDDVDIINAFVSTFEEGDDRARLSRYFRNEADNISRRSTNEEIQTWLEKQRDEAVARAMEIIRTRVDRYGVNEPSIVKQGQNRIVVELAGVSNQERVRSLLKGTARLEFRLGADADELQRSLERVITYFNDQTDAEGDSLTQAQNKLLDVFVPQGRSIIFGAATAQDTAQAHDLLTQPEVQKLLPRGIDLMWTASPSFTGNNGQEYFNLIAVREQVELTGSVIEEARPNFDQYSNAPEVSMSMNSEGARRWARITGANINKPIAIVLDGYVYTYPNVITKINDGRSSITGLSSLQEAEDLVNILMSGALPAPLDIVEERTVGPTLGQASIESGTNSILLGLGIVAVFMIFYYRKAGAIADLALFLNIVFIFGILAAFKATLTLPGLAGIVLTIGMAVDANVLIFDRIREEMVAGKSMLAAIDGGYSNAMSAIVDANVTTFLTGAILYSFGVGPIKGFAVTLMAGIVCSLFSAIVITRLVVDYTTREKGSKISIG